jgi:DNA-binding GntR family transcriptional regulator
LRDYAYQTLRTAIFEGRLPPGSRIIEARVSEALGISRGTLREAMRQLQSEGLVITRTHRETRVVSLSGAAIVDLYGARAALEGYAATLGLDTLRMEHLPAMQAELDLLDQAAQDRAWERVAMLDAAWHAHILTAAKSTHLETMWAASNGPLLAVFTRAVAAIYQPHAVRARHALLLDVLRTAELWTIETAIRTHYLESAHAFAAVCDGQAPAEDPVLA